MYIIAMQWRWLMTWMDILFVFDIFMILSVIPTKVYLLFWKK